MNVGFGPSRLITRGLLLVGVLLLFLFSLAHVQRFISVRAAMASFEARQEALQPATEIDVGQEVKNTAQQSVEPSSWRLAGIKVYEGSFGQSGELLGVLRIPALHLEVPVLEGTDGPTLHRGVGRIAGTSFPGENGNIGIAGHRDSFFRRLEDISKGDFIELVTLRGTSVYEVDQIRVTTPADLGVLQPRAKSSLTLVTCYPFQFIGPAPSRYIVEASLSNESFDHSTNPR
jgi:sortase A